MSDNTHTYLGDGISSVQEMVDRFGPIYDSSALSNIQKCPRKFQLRIIEGLDSPEPSRKMVAGIAIHEALDYYYAQTERTPQTELEAIEVLAREWNEWGGDEMPLTKKNSHVTEEHLRGCLAQYFDIWERQRFDVYKPVGGLTPDDLNLEDVLMAEFKLTPAGHVILGESKLVMRFDVGDRQVILAGRPDLPVMDQVGNIYIMDHKTTSSWISSWWFAKWDASNKLRGYMAMVRELLELDRVRGAIINGIYVGKYALNPDSTATKVDREVFDFTPGHVEEALRNILDWQDTVRFYEQRDHFPQACGYGGCDYPEICKARPSLRGEVARQHYEPNYQHFLDR